ncbi:MAG: hypothetical protein OZ923_06215 [Comamonadaceae bacterium]|nr:hypothetical protein [Burkholderiales bacterium]MEB2348188.1 hypothetical protein [Comamonadaceae bacterium]
MHDESVTGTRPHAFEATLDEMTLLKHLEMGAVLGVPQALRHHLSDRLVTAGYIAKTEQGLYALTDAGRALIRRRGS